MRIGYFADGPWAHRALSMILESSIFQVGFVCVRNDFRDPVLVEMAESHSIPVFSHANVNSDEFLVKVKSFKCELFVSMSFNQIFKKQILEVTRLGIVNCHAGQLPFYRGRNILNWALINDESEFGITVHFVDEGIDTGDIILQKTFPISDEDDYGSLLKIAQHECANILFEALVSIQKGNYERHVQADIHPLGFYCVRRIPGDEVLNWFQSSREIFNFVRAVAEPGPLAHTTLNGETVTIGKVVLLKDAVPFKGVPGSVLGRTEFGYLVKTVDSCVEIQKVNSARKLRIGDRLI